MEFDRHSLVIVLDGYGGSKDEFLGRPDRTAEVFGLAITAFPQAQIHRLSRNYGIGLAYELLEAEVFAGGDSPWGLFLEEDFVLYPMYLEAMSQLVAHVDSHGKVAVVSATGDTRTPLTRGKNELYPQTHLWAFALRRSHYEARRPLLAPFLTSISGRPYWQRDNRELSLQYLRRGMFLRGSSQDCIKRAIMGRLRKIAVTTGTAYGQYIGQSGEHSDPEMFRQMGFGFVAPVPATFEPPAVLTDQGVQRLVGESKRKAAAERVRALRWHLGQWRQKIRRFRPISLM